MAEQMTFDVVAKDKASSELAKIGRNVDTLADKLDRLGEKTAKPKVTLDSDQAKNRLTDFSQKLAALSNKRVRLDVDVAGTDKVGDLRRELSYISDRKVKIRVDTADSNQKLKTITDRLKLIEDKKAKVDVTVTGDGKVGDLLDKLRRLQEFSPVKVKIELEDVTGALGDIRAVLNALILLDGYRARAGVEVQGSAEARAEIEALRRALREIDGSSSTATVSVRQDWDKSIEGKIGNLIGKLLKIPAAAAAGSASVGVLGASLASLVGGLAQVGQAAPVAVGGLAALGAVVATVKVGTSGVGDAMKAVADGDAKKLAASLKDLAPPAREFVTEVGKFETAFKGVQLDVQARLFAGLGKEIDQLGRAYLPSLDSGLTGIAMELNAAGRGVLDFAESGQAVSRVDEVFRNTRLAVANVAPAAANVTAALLDIGAVGSDVLPELTQGATAASERFREFIANARESGQLAGWIQTGIDRLQQLGDIAGNVGGILGGVFQAANAEGVDFITRLQVATQGVDDFVHSADGQNGLRAFFQESRQTVDALVPGLKSLASAVSESVQGFDRSDGMVKFGSALSDVAETVSPLVTKLGELAGGTLGVLSSSVSNVATGLSPLISGFSGLLGIMGPIAPAVIGMVAAFAGMRLVGGYLTTAAVSLTVFGQAQFAAAAASTTAAGAYARSGLALGAAGLAGAASTAAKALPLLGIAIVAGTALWDAFAVKADEAAEAVVNGSLSMSQAAEQVMEQQQKRAATGGILDLMFGSDDEMARKAAALDTVRVAVEEQLKAMGGMDELQGRVAVSTKNLDDAVVQYGKDSPQAAEAARVLARDTDALKAKQNEAAEATKTHEDRIKDLGDTMREQAGAHLAYEEAVQRTADAQKEAAAALKASGEKSEEYQAEVRDLATAFLAQADAAKATAAATGGAAAGNQAYIQELLRLNNGTQAGHDALVKLAEGFDDTTLKGIDAASAATGLRTEIVKLPNGKTVTLVVAADANSIPTVQAQLDELANKKYVGTIELNGRPQPFQDTVLQSVKLADGTVATMKLDANGEPLSVAVQGQKYLIDSTTGLMKIDGDPAPGVANLDGFRVKVDQTTGKLMIDATAQPAEGQLSAFVGKVNTARGVATIDGDPSLFEGKTTSAIRFADGSTGTVTIDGNEKPVNGKITAQVTYANGSTGTITLDAADANVRAAQANAKLPLNTTWTVAPNTTAADAARTRLQQPLSATLTINTYTKDGGGSGYVGNGVGGRLNARGSIIAPSGVQLFADGGTWPHLTPMAVGKAAVVPPNTWRVVGDRADVPEAYIPLKRGDVRANRLLDISAVALGRTVLPMAAGGTLGQTPKPAVTGAGGSGLDKEFVDTLDAATKSTEELDAAQQDVADTLDDTDDATAALSTSTDTLTSSTGAYTAAAQTRTAAEQTGTAATSQATGAAATYTDGLATLAGQAGGTTTAGIQTLTGAQDTSTASASTAAGQAQAYTGGLAALGAQAGGGTTAGVQSLTGAVSASGAASVTATGQAQGHTSGLAALGTQAGGGTAAGLGTATQAANTLGAAHTTAAGQAQAQAGQLTTLAGSATTAARELQGVATAINNLPDGDFVVTATGRLGDITGAPTVKAASGAVLPGWSPGRDIHSFVSPTGGRLELSGGEAVMRPEWTAAMGPAYVDAANKAARAGTLRDFLARTAPRQGQEFAGDGSMLATGGVIRTQRYALGGTIGRLGNPFPPMPSTLWAQLAGQMADRLTPTMQAAVKAEEDRRAGGNIVEWARGEVGKPYIWGGVGPAGYDCSGWVSNLLNVKEGKPPHSRRGTTASFPWGGFTSGLGDGLNVGAFKGDPGHMAATVNGINLESSGSVGVRVGGGARGASDGMFTIRAHIAKDGGVLPHFDQGGLASGSGLMVKDVIHPERILSGRQTQAFERLVDRMPIRGADRVQLGQPTLVGSGGPAINVGVLQAAAADLRNAAAAIRDQSGQAPVTIHVESQGPDPVQTARATALAFRMARH